MAVAEITAVSDQEMRMSESTVCELYSDGPIITRGQNSPRQPPGTDTVDRSVGIILFRSYLLVIKLLSYVYSFNQRGRWIEQETG